MNAVSLEFSAPFPLAKSHTAAGQLLKTLGAHNAERARYAADREALLGIDSADFTVDNETQASRLRSRKRQLLLDEIAIREEAAAIYEQIATVDQPEALDAAITTRESVIADVTASLIKIGFVGHDGSGTEIATRMAHQHPAVSAAGQRIDAARAVDGIRAGQTANDQSIVSARKSLAEFKSRAVAGLLA